VEVAGRKVCVLCASQFVRDARPLRPLWPTLYIFAIGLLSPVAPPVLAALNWLRLGDARRARACLFLVVAGGVATVGQMVTVMEKLPPERQWPFSVAGLLVAFFSTVALAPRYAEHRHRGGPRANLLVPVGLTLVMTLGLMLGVLGYLVARGKVSPDALTKPGAFDSVSWMHRAPVHAPPHPAPPASNGRG